MSDSGHVDRKPMSDESKVESTGIRAAILHPICLAGWVVAACGLGASLIALAFDMWSGHEAPPYQGLLTFMLYPAVLMLGLTIVVAGVIYQRRRAKKLANSDIPIRPPIDWNDKRHRRIFALSVFLTVAFVFGSIIGATRAYHFTESIEFCGALCHEPMDPQYVAHSKSPHANVPCVECHVGHEVTSYVEAKISGMRQVYQVATDSFKRPIRLPVEHSAKLARNCLNCHWEEVLQESQLSIRTRFGYDAASSRRHIQMLLRNGGLRDPGEDPAIHWHAGLENRIEYWFRDEFAQEVARVSVREKSGKIVTFDRHKAGKRLYDDVEVDEMHVLGMSCLTCHNRPAHKFKTPDELVDRALLKREIASTLPFVKRIAIETMSGRHEPKDEALRAIEREIKAFYEKNFPSVAESREQEIADTIATVQKAYAENNFPGMRISGATYADNIGHRAFPGCFRCHDGNMIAPDGEKIEDRCDLCHVFFEEARTSASLREIPADASALHPFQSKDHAKIACWSCHTGHDNPQDGCAECHEKEVVAPGMNFSCSTCHSPEDHNPRNSQCASCHPTGNSAMHVIADHQDCQSCHAPHDWRKREDQTCASCHKTRKCEERQKNDPQQRTCVQCHEFKGMESTMHGLDVPWDMLRIFPTGGEARSGSGARPHAGEGNRRREKRRERK